MIEVKCSTRLTNALKNAGFQSFAEVENLMLVPMGPETIQRLPNLGAACFKELKEVIASRKVVSMRVHTMVKAFEEEVAALVRDVHTYNNEGRSSKYPDFTTTKCVEIRERINRRSRALSDMYKEGIQKNG